MAVAALVDAGVPAAVVTGAIEAMGVRGLRVAFGRRKRGAFVGRSFDVSWPGQAARRAAGRSWRTGPSARPRARTTTATHDHAHDHGPRQRRTRTTTATTRR